MRALFLADAHLRRPSDTNYQALLAFLENEVGRLDQLVLLGDIFEFWAGDRRNLHASYRPLVEQLERLHRSGTRMVYVEGNHDFDLGAQFSERLDCRILPDGGGIELDGRQVYLAHGDLANPEDRGYQFLRRLLRTPVLRWLIRHVPISLVLGIAMRSSRESRATNAEKRRRWPARDVLIPYAQNLIDQGYATVVTGHFHDPFRETLKGGELIALGDWIGQFSYLVYEEGTFNLLTHSPE